MELVVTIGAIRRAKLQSYRHHQQTNTQLFTGQMPFLSPNQKCQSIEGKISHSMDLLTPSSPGGLPTSSLTTNSSWLPWGGLPCLSSALWCQYPLTGVFFGEMNKMKSSASSNSRWCPVLHGRSALPSRFVSPLTSLFSPVFFISFHLNVTVV